MSDDRSRDDSEDSIHVSVSERFTTRMSEEIAESFDRSQLIRKTGMIRSRDEKSIKESVGILCKDQFIVHFGKKKRHPDQIEDREDKV